MCELALGRTLRLWIPSGPVPRLVANDHPLQPLQVRVVDGGTLYAVLVPPAATWIEVRDDARDGAARHQPFHLSIKETSAEPVLAEAVRLRKAGQGDRAERLLTNALSTLPSLERDRAQALLARLALAGGRSDEAIRGLQQALARARASGRLSEALDDACALAFALAIHALRLSEAQAVVGAAEPLAGDFPEGRARLPYYAAQIRTNSGDIRGALRGFRLAAERAARLGMAADEAAARQEIADTMASLGRTDEAVTLQQAVIRDLPTGGDPCVRARSLIALSWFVMQAALREGQAPSSGGAATALVAARNALQTCTDPFARRVAVTNEALYALQTGDLAGARTRLGELQHDVGQRQQNLAVWELEVEARLDLGRGRPARALRLFQRQEERALVEGYADGAFRALVGQGKALHVLGRPAIAAQRYRGAEEILERTLHDIPLGEGKDAFAGSREESSRLLVEALLTSGDLVGAMRTIRSARVRLLASTAAFQQIDQLTAERRSEWERLVSQYRLARRDFEEHTSDARRIPAADRDAIRDRRRKQQVVMGSLVDQLHNLIEGTGAGRPLKLRTPPAGELLVAYFPLAGDSVGVSEIDGRMSAHRLGSIDVTSGVEALSSQLLAPFASEFQRARSVRFLPYGTLEGVDLHALPFRGAPLVELLPVEYGADLPGDKTSARSRAPDQRRRAVLVADPDLTLPAARAEVDALSALLAPRFAVQVLSGAGATRDAILAALSGAGLFHFAGHAWFTGIDGIDSSLGAAHKQRIVVGDVLTVREGPRIVVLSACESARSARKGSTGGLPGAWGIGQAFLVAGATAVVAASRPVLDTAARNFMNAFYEELTAIPPPSVSAAVRAAQRRALSAGGANEAVSFRVLAP